MIKHTPGPWAISAIFPDKSRGHDFDPSVSIVAHSEEFATRIRLADIPDVLSEDCEEMANARLIAAAPELLDNLKLLLEWVDGQKRGGFIHKGLDFPAARAAIAKAESDIKPCVPNTYYECGICGALHNAQWDGDCREDSARFNPEDLDAKHGCNGWEEIAMEDMDAWRERNW